MYEIEWQPKAYRQLMKIKERETLAAIRDAVFDLANWPHCRNVKAMRNHESGYRLLVSRWRVLFEVQDRIRVIMIQEVKKRDEQTY
ncbi:MAG: type II toxin-antitoxin system RelE/ParE family toxin [Pseudomonadota bacterium]